jgi:hypothetical protein
MRGVVRGGEPMTPTDAIRTLAGRAPQGQVEQAWVTIRAFMQRHAPRDADPELNADGIVGQLAAWMTARETALNLGDRFATFDGVDDPPAWLACATRYLCRRAARQDNDHASTHSGDVDDLPAPPVRPSARDRVAAAFTDREPLCVAWEELVDDCVRAARFQHRALRRENCALLLDRYLSDTPLATLARAAAPDGVDPTTLENTLSKRMSLTRGYLLRTLDGLEPDEVSDELRLQLRTLLHLLSPPKPRGTR